MNSQKIIEYVRSQITERVPEEAIKAQLKAGGYSDADIDYAMKHANAAPPPLPTYDPSDGYRVRGRSTLQYLAVGFFSTLVFGAIIFSILYYNVTFDWDGIRENAEQFVSKTRSIGRSVSSSWSLPETDTVPVPASTAQDDGMQAIFAPAPVTGASASGSGAVSNEDKDEIASALLTMDSVLDSGNAASIRNYLATAAPPGAAGALMSMNDQAVLDLASKLRVGSEAVTADNLFSSRTTWTRVDDSTVNISINTVNGAVTRTSRKINGIWY